MNAITARIVKAVGFAQIIVAFIVVDKDMGIALTFAALGAWMITLPHTPTQKQRQQHRRWRWR